MHDNITKVAERGERLDALQDKTGELDMDTFGIAVSRKSTSGLLVRQQKAGSSCWINWKDDTGEMLGLLCLIVSRLSESL